MLIGTSEMRDRLDRLDDAVVAKLEIVSAQVRQSVIPPSTTSDVDSYGFHARAKLRGLHGGQARSGAAHGRLHFHTSTRRRSNRCARGFVSRPIRPERLEDFRVHPQRRVLSSVHAGLRPLGRCGSGAPRAQAALIGRRDASRAVAIQRLGLASRWSSRSSSDPRTECGQIAAQLDRRGMRVRTRNETRRPAARCP